MVENYGNFHSRCSHLFRISHSLYAEVHDVVALEVAPRPRRLKAVGARRRRICPCTRRRSRRRA